MSRLARDAKAGRRNEPVMHGENANTPFLAARAGVSTFPMCLLLW